MNNFYHKQKSPPRNRRDRVVVIDSAGKSAKPPLNPDNKSNQNNFQSIKRFLIVVMLMLAVLYLSIKTLEFLWSRRDQSIHSSISSNTVKQEAPAILSPAMQIEAPVSPPPPIGSSIESSQTNDQDKVETIYRWGKVLEEAGEFDGALARYGEALDIAPDNTVILSQMGRLNIQLARYSNAVVILEKAILHSDNNPDIMNDLGVAMTFNNQTADAVALYDNLLEEYPDYVPALFNKGYALVQLHDYENARPLLESYIGKKSDDAMAYGVLAVLELSEKKHDAALALLDKAIAAAPTWSTPYLDAATICAGTDQGERALTYLERALEFTPPADIYQQFQGNAFRSIRLTEEGKALEKKIADRARQYIK
jgi:tetratricopeptide (TPR) repeat protein